MAFNPFHAFQKNKKFWMSAVLLVTMITFVFCAGQGDMQDRIINLFRKRGTTVATVGGTNLSQEDLHRLRGERNKVNEFMLKCCRITADNMTRLLMDEQKKPLPTDEKKKKEIQDDMVHLNAMQLSLLDRLRPRPGETQPRYFEGGVKFDDLVEFKIWQAKADRLGIRLESEDVNELLRLQFFSTRQRMFIDPNQIEDALAMARGADTSSADFRRALTEEFRVRIARLAMIEMQAKPFYTNQPLPFVDPTIPDQQRAHVTLAQIWKVYQEKRAELDVTLIPVHVADFGKEVFDQKPPTDQELEKLFEKYRKEKYEPTSPLPSFESPNEVRVEYIMADPTSPLYQGAARAKMTLETTLPLIGNPLQSPLVAAARAGAFAAGKQKNVGDVLEGLSRPKAFELYNTADLSSSHFIWPLAAHFAQSDPAACASVVGNIMASLGDPALVGAPAFAGFLNLGARDHAAEIEAGVTAESKRRTQPWAEIAASGAIGQPYAMTASAIKALKLFPFRGTFYSEQLLLPMPIIERDLENVLVNRTAEQWASRSLLAVKKQLDKTNNKAEAVKRVINELPKNTITHVATKGFYNRYTIDSAPELKPLKEAYEKYYAQVNWFEKRDVTPERMLKDSDFYKLFFENERFSSARLYQVQPWPPEVFPNQLQVRTLPGMHAALDKPNIDENVLADVQNKMQHQDLSETRGYKLLDKAQKPILFWRADDKPAKVPDSLAAARARVIEAWKIEKARELKALPTARKIAEDLLEARGEYTPKKLKDASLEAKHESILIPRIAPMSPKDVGERFKGGRREYYPYQLPKDRVTLPRDEMVAELLALYGLKQPIKMEMVHPEFGEPAFVKELNDLNKALFDKAKKENKPHAFVQVLTNKPQNIYYVAVVTLPPFADRMDFKESVIAFASEAQFQFRPVDSFVTRAQEILAREFHAELLRQIGDEIGYKNNFDTKDRLDFDKGADTGS